MVLFIAGDQIPVTPFEEVVGKAAKLSPEHIGAIAGRKIATKGFTTIFIVVIVAHCPAVGVKV